MDPSEDRQLWWPSLLPVVSLNFKCIFWLWPSELMLTTSVLSCGISVRVAHRSHSVRTAARRSLI